MRSLDFFSQCPDFVRFYMEWQKKQGHIPLTEKLCCKPGVVVRGSLLLSPQSPPQITTHGPSVFSTPSVGLLNTMRN